MADVEPSTATESLPINHNEKELLTDKKDSTDVVEPQPSSSTGGETFDSFYEEV